MHTQGLGGGPADPAAPQLPELLRSRLDSWYPQGLPARFRPLRRHRLPSVWRPVPLLLAAVLLVLLAAVTLAGPSRGLTDVLVNLAGRHPAPTPTPHSQGAAPAGSVDSLRSAQRISTAAVASTPPSQAGPPQSALPHSVTASGPTPGTASRPRTASRQPTTAVVVSPPALLSTAPSPPPSPSASHPPRIASTPSAPAASQPSSRISKQAAFPALPIQASHVGALPIS